MTLTTFVSVVGTKAIAVWTKRRTPLLSSSAQNVNVGIPKLRRKSRRAIAAYAKANVRNPNSKAINTVTTRTTTVGATGMVEIAVVQKTTTNFVTTARV